MAQSQYGGRSDLSDKASDLKDQATDQIKKVADRSKVSQAMRSTSCAIPVPVKLPATSKAPSTSR